MSDVGSKKWLAVQVCCITTLVMCTAGVERPTTRPAVEQQVRYTVFIGTSRSAFESDDSLAGYDHKKSFQGTPQIWLNGNPLTFYPGRNEAMMTGVTAYVQNGMNDLTLVGEFERPLYVKVARFVEGAAPTTRAVAPVVGKQIFDPEAKPAPHLTFAAAMPQLPRFDHLDSNPTQRESDGRGAVKLVDRLVTALRDHRGRDIGELLTQGRRIWGPALMGDTKNDLIGAAQAKATRFAKPDLEVVQETEPLEYQFGKSMVLVYRKGFPSRDHAGFSFRVRSQGKKDFIEPLHLVRIRGEWMIW